VVGKLRINENRENQAGEGVTAKTMGVISVTARSQPTLHGLGAMFRVIDCIRYPRFRQSKAVR